MIPGTKGEKMMMIQFVEEKPRVHLSLSIFVGRSSCDFSAVLVLKSKVHSSRVTFLIVFDFETGQVSIVV